MLKKALLILVTLGFLFCIPASAEEAEEYIDLANSGLQIRILPPLQPAEPENPEDVLYYFRASDGPGRLLVRHYATSNSLDALYEYLVENRTLISAYGITEFDGVPLITWRVETAEESIYRAFGIYETDASYALDIMFEDMNDAAFAEAAEQMMASIRRGPEAAGDAQWKTVSENVLKQDHEQAAGDYTYTLSKYDKAIIRSVPPTDTPGKLLIPTTLDGYEVGYLEASCIPEDIQEILMPPRCALRNIAYLTHEVITYTYCDQAYMEDWNETRSPYVFMGPDDLVIRHGNSDRYVPGKKRENLVQDYYLYPTSVSGKKIWLDLYADDVTLYTSGLYTYYKLSPETICLCQYGDTEAKKVTVPETVDGLTVTATGLLPGTDHASVLFVTNATDIHLPSTLKVLGRNSLYSSKLKSLTLPEGLEEIGDGAIESWSLKKVNMPSTLRSIGSYFMHANISNLTLPDSVTRISPHAFDELFLKSVTLPSGLTEIPSVLFNKQQLLTSITLPAGVTSIGRSAFQNCYKLKTVKTQGTSLKVIEESAFEDSTALSKITLPEGLEEIRSRAFYGCKKLSKLVIPSTLRKIGANAFSGCTGLKQITLGANVEEIDPTAFEGGAKKLTIVAPEDSYAAEFAKNHGYGYKILK